MFQTKKIKAKINQRIKLKTITSRKKINEVKSKAYLAVYTTSKQKMHINELYQTTVKSNPAELTKVYNTLLEKAKEKNVKKIIGIKPTCFVVQKEFAEKLGFKMIKGTDLQLKFILKKFPNHKIKKANFSYLDNLYSLTLVHKDTKKIKEITLYKLKLPVFVKKL